MQPRTGDLVSKVPFQVGMLNSQLTSFIPIGYWTIRSSLEVGLEASVLRPHSRASCHPVLPGKSWFVMGASSKTSSPSGISSLSPTAEAARLGDLSSWTK